MNHLLSNNLFMLGLTYSKEMPVYPGWVMAENLHQCDVFYQMMYPENRKARKKKNRVLFFLLRKKPKASNVEQTLMD